MGIRSKKSGEYLYWIWKKNGMSSLGEMGVPLQNELRELAFYWVGWSNANGSALGKSDSLEMGGTIEKVGFLRPG